MAHISVVLAHSYVMLRITECLLLIALYPDLSVYISYVMWIWYFRWIELMLKYICMPISGLYL